MSDTNNRETIDALNTAFEEFKKTNDDRLKAVEKKGAADPLDEQRLERIDAELAELQKKAARPSLNSASNQQELEHKTAFAKWARKGVEAGELEEFERKAVTLNNGDASGGFLLPKVVEAGIRQDLRTLSPIRSRADVVSISSNDYRYLKNLRGLQTGWVGETDPRPETATPTLAETSVPMGEIYANPAVSQRALDDSAFDLEAWMQTNIGEEFEIEENKQFLIGDGVNKPKGILTTAGLKTIKSGVAAGMPATTDYIFDMVYGLSAAYRTGSVFMGNGLTISGERKKKDANNNYIWQPSLQAGTPATLAGYEVLEVEDMPDVAANAYPLVFGNLKGYLIADRIGIRTLRDPFTHKPFVHFYATKRVGGMVQDLKAFVALQNKA